MLHNSRERSEKYVKPRSENKGTGCSRHWIPLEPMLKLVYLDGTVANVQPMLKQFVKDCIPWQVTPPLLPAPGVLEEFDKDKE